MKYPKRIHPSCQVHPHALRHLGELPALAVEADGQPPQYPDKLSPWQLVTFLFFAGGAEAHQRLQRRDGVRGAQVAAVAVSVVL